MPYEVHEKAIRVIEAKYRKRGYKTILNSADQVRVPDLLMISPIGKVLWVEVEDYKNAQKAKKFMELRNEMKTIDAEFHVYYLHIKKSQMQQLTRLAKSTL
jgi:hypothetical protein